MTNDQRLIVVLGSLASHFYLIGVFVAALLWGNYASADLILAAEGMTAVTYQVMLVAGDRFTENLICVVMCASSWLLGIVAGLWLL